jgi:murein L,D-transpeptidase YcbB/YkuD
LLRDALTRYRALAAGPQPATLPAPARASVKPGDAYAGMSTLRARLVQLGDLERSALTTQTGDWLDGVTSMALVRFQVRHRLDVDGALGRVTLEALNVPLSKRVRQIEFALERSRWLPSRLASPPIIVNIPQFELFAFRTTEDRERDILIMDVVVGKVFPQNNTPVFVADMKQVVLRPFWDVPRSILLGELLPQIKANPNWVANNGFEIVRGQGDDGVVVTQSAESVAALESGSLRLRQKPGPRNALGNAKFLFPNRFNVYLHDTPSQGAFAQSRRAASHGCVRVIDPPALARHVLRNNPEWSAERIDAAMNAETGTRITLAQPIRVFLIYATALALEDGRVLFFEDIYHHDEKLDRVW